MNHKLLPILSFLALPLYGCTTVQMPLESVDIPAIYTSAAMTAIAGARFSSLIATPVKTATEPATSPAQGTSVPITSAATSPRIRSADYAKPISISAANACHNASFLRDMNVPDNEEIAPGESFVKTWKFMNTGSCPWRRKFSMVFRRGDLLGGSDTEIEKVIDPGGTVKISVALTAPEKEGTYTGYWMLADPGGNAFGNEVYVRIIVSTNAAASVP